MVHVMFGRFICPRGHEWQLLDDNTCTTTGEAILCPICGARGLPEHPAGAAEGSGAAPTWATASVDLTIAGERFRTEVRIPTAPVRPRQMLPVLQALTDFVADRSVKAVEANGEQLSCKKGCAACCRQLVPITLMEAYHLRDLVARLPEPRQTEVRARFVSAAQRLQEEALLEKLRHPEQLQGDEVEPLALQYFSLQIACPFLEDGMCSIYADRPLACREYLVTSAVEHCSRPAEEQVRGVPLAAKVSRAAARLGQTQRSELLPHVPLILAPEWAAAHPEEKASRPGPELVRELFDLLAPPAAP